MRSLKIIFLYIFLFAIVSVLLVFTPTQASAQTPCALSGTNPSVTICTPANGATVTSPLRIAAGTTDSRKVTMMQIYVDGVKAYQVNAKSLDTRVSMAVGTRRIVVQARDSAAKWFSQTISVNVVSSLPAVSVNVSPASANLATGASQQFTASVSGTTNTAVTWSATGGTVSSTGLYTAPGTAGTYTVRATSVADGTKSASAGVTVTAASTLLLNVSPTSLPFGSVMVGSSGSKTATLSNSGNSTVTVFSASTTGPGFTVTGLTFPFTIAAGANRSVTVQFAPQGSGAATGTASFSSNASNTPTSVSLSGTGTNPVAHSVDLNWNASTSVVSGYNVYRAGSSGGPYIKQNSALQIPLNYTDSTVQSGLSYFYVITAVDLQGRESANSNEVVAIIPSP